MFAGLVSLGDCSKFLYVSWKHQNRGRRRMNWISKTIGRLKKGCAPEKSFQKMNMS
jgi:hypothetical protein